MIINYLGGGSFRLQSGETVLTVDPASNRWKSDITLRTSVNIEELNAPGLGEVLFPGEYEIGGIEIQGFPVAAESSEKLLKTIYLVRWEELTLAFLGSVSSAPESAVIKEIEEPDILFLPTGPGFLSGEAAAKLVRQLEPAVVIPSFKSDAKDFLKSMGEKGEPQEKFVFKKKELQPKQMRVVLLEAHS